MGNNILRSLFASQKNEEVTWKEKYTFPHESLGYEEEDLLAMCKLMSEQEQWFMEQYAVVTMNTPQSHGMVLKSNEESDYEFFEHFMHFIRTKVKKGKGYYNPVSEKKFVECQDQKKNTIFIYLKPSPRTCSNGIKHDQRLSLIHI